MFDWIAFDADDTLWKNEEEYLHGRLHKLRTIVTKIESNRYIEYAPTSKLLRYYFPKGTFIRSGPGTFWD